MKGTRLASRRATGRRPLGVTHDGREIWPIIGAEKDDDDDDDDDEDDSDSEDSDDDDEDTDDQDGDGDGADKSKKDKSKKDDDDSDSEGDEEIAEMRRRADRYKARMKAADDRANKAERENRRLKAAGTPLSEQDKEDLKEARLQVASSTEVIQTLRLQVALLSDNTYQWHDPSLVLKALSDDDGVEIDEDGKVVGVKQALRRIAREKPFLVKTPPVSKKDDDEDTDEDDEEPTRKRTSGSPANARKRKSTVPDRKTLTAKYPALSRR